MRRADSSVGRAQPLQGWGRRFEPCSAHHLSGAYDDRAGGYVAARRVNLGPRVDLHHRASTLADLAVDGNALAALTVATLLKRSIRWRETIKIRRRRALFRAAVSSRTDSDADSSRDATRRRRLSSLRARPVVGDYRPSARTSPATRTIARSAAAPMTSESRGMLVMPVNQSKKQAVTLSHLSARSTPR